MCVFVVKSCNAAFLPCDVCVALFGADSLSRWELARWNLALRVVQMQYNRTVHLDLGVSPNEMMGLSSWRGCHNGG